MPNWCSNRYAFYTQDEDKSELVRFYKTLCDILHAPPSKENDFAPDWLGNIATQHGFDWGTYPCRGSFEIPDDNDPEYGVFKVDSETAWAPTTELWEAVVKQYKNISFVYIAEEPGAGFYVNTDIQGNYLPERYLLDIYGDAPFPDGWYANEKNKPEYIEICEYFDSFIALRDYCANFTGKTFESITDLQEYFCDVSEGRYELCIGVREFTAD